MITAGIPLRAQLSGDVSHYYFSATKNTPAVLSPVAHIRTSNNWYGEARYNYDELQTFSLYGGKTFSQEGNFSWEATPVIGGLVGQMNGGSMGINLGMGLNNLFFSSQTQYTFSFEEKPQKYFFNWSELGYEATNWFYAGVAMQQTSWYRNTPEFSPGCMIGFSIKNWTIPVYAFQPVSDSRYLVIGVNYRWQKSKTDKRPVNLAAVESK